MKEGAGQEGEKSQAQRTAPAGQHPVVVLRQLGQHGQLEGAGEAGRQDGQWLPPLARESGPRHRVVVGKEELGRGKWVLCYR